MELGVNSRPQCPTFTFPYQCVVTLGKYYLGLVKGSILLITSAFVSN